jgi:amino acid transporter
VTPAIADDNVFRERLRRFVRRKLWKLGRCRRCIASTAVLAAVSMFVLSITAPASESHRLALTAALVFGGLLIAHGVAWIIRRTRPQPGM